MGFSDDFMNDKQRGANSLKTLEVYYKNRTCGDPVPGYGQEPMYTKRKMYFNRLTFWLDAEFVCPVCGAIRSFRYDVLKGGSQEKG